MTATLFSFFFPNEDKQEWATLVWKEKEIFLFSSSSSKLLIWATLNHSIFLSCPLSIKKRRCTSLILTKISAIFPSIFSIQTYINCEYWYSYHKTQYCILLIYSLLSICPEFYHESSDVHYDAYYPGHWLNWPNNGRYWSFAFSYMSLDKWKLCLANGNDNFNKYLFCMNNLDSPRHSRVSHFKVCTFESVLYLAHRFLSFID